MRRWLPAAPLEEGLLWAMRSPGWGGEKGYRGLFGESFGGIRPWRPHSTSKHGGEGGIRTRDRLLTYTRFPGVLLKPLGHLSEGARG